MLPYVDLSCPKLPYYTQSCPTLPYVALSYPKVALRLEFRVGGVVVVQTNNRVKPNFS